MWMHLTDSHTGKNMVSAKQGFTSREVCCLCIFSRGRQRQQKSYKIFQKGSPTGEHRKVLFPPEGLAPIKEKEQHRIPFVEVQESEKVALTKGTIHKSSLVTSASNSSKIKSHFPSKRYWVFCTLWQGTGEVGSRQKSLCGALWDTQSPHNLCFWSIVMTATTETFSCLQVRAVVSLIVPCYPNENSLFLVLLMNMQQHRLSVN